MQPSKTAQITFIEIDLTTNVVNFKLLSKQLQRHGNIMFIYDFFILGDTSFNLTFLINDAYGARYKHPQLFVVSLIWKH